ncbi:MAG: hypothetical protein NDP22_01620 [Crenarchaeota archaeon]|nr:hypothetical protein [Thermoproteota archaeon]
MACSFILAVFWPRPTQDKKEFAKSFVMHLNAITIIFLVSAKWLIRGVDAEETSADTLNIYYNGGFQYSMHAGWYDLAPVDSILKVMLLRVCGNNDPFSSSETFLISFIAGLSLYILVYIYVKMLSLKYMLPLIPALLALHPYAFLPGVATTPTNIAIALALASLIMFLHSTQNSSRSHLIVSRILFITSLLAHPFTISILIFIVACLLAKYFDGSLRSQDVSFFLSTLILWLTKTIYTATLYGVVSIWNSIANGVFQVWERESLISFKNIGYFNSPKLALASFSASLGIIGGITVVISYYALRRRHVKNCMWLSFSIAFFACFTGVSSFFGALGGQSRYTLVPFASLFFFPILFYCKVKHASWLLKALITFASVLTILAPNFMPDQYSFAMAAKVADRTMFEISAFLFEKLDPIFVINRFQGTSDMRLYINQKSKFIRNMGEAGLIVDKLILRGVVSARSYWNFVGRGPFDAVEESCEYSTFNIVMDTGLLKVLSLWINH